jgi:hypothetical protein
MVNSIPEEQNEVRYLKVFLYMAKIE